MTVQKTTEAKTMHFPPPETISEHLKILPKYREMTEVTFTYDDLFNLPDNALRGTCLNVEQPPTENIPLHDCMIDTLDYPLQPQMADVYRRMVNRWNIQKHSIEEIVRASSKGQSVIQCHHRINEDGKPEYVASTLLVPDFDDNERLYSHEQIAERLKGYVCAVSTTFSHHTHKGNRYRLWMQFDKPIPTVEDWKLLFEYYQDLFNSIYCVHVDGQARNPVNAIRGGRMGYIMNDFNLVLSLDSEMEKAKEWAEKHRKKRQEKLSDTTKDYRQAMLLSGYDYQFDDYKSMAEHIGYMPSGTDTRNTWLSFCFAFAQSVREGILTDEQGYELYSIISGDESNRAQWQGFLKSKPTGDAITIATFIHLSKELYGWEDEDKFRRFKKSRLKDLSNYQYPIKTESMPLEDNRYIKTDLMYQLLNKRMRILVDSPTGSGKTKNTMKALRKLVEDDKNTLCIFTTPNTVLTSQIGKTEGIPYYNQQTDSSRNKIINDWFKENRIFATTYDKTYDVIHAIHNGIDYTNPNGPDFKKPKIVLIIDEIHELSLSFNYRQVAIRRVLESMQLATTVVGLSGTHDATCKELFDRMVVTEGGQRKSPCNEFAIIEMDNRDIQTKKVNPDLNIAYIVQTILFEISQGRKVLNILNSKRVIKLVARELKKHNVKVATIVSEQKLNSKVFESIASEERILNDVQVVLSTSLLTTGVNILNRKEDGTEDRAWTCIVVSNEDTSFFSPTYIKQFSNRLRLPYDRFILMLPKQMQPDRENDSFFVIDREYMKNKPIVDAILNDIKQEFEGHENELTESKIEKINGIYYDKESNEIKCNPLVVMNIASREQVNYYRMFFEGFKRDVARLLGVPCKKVIEVNHAALIKDNAFQMLLESISQEAETIQNEEQDKKTKLDMYFKVGEFEALRQGDKETEDMLKVNLHGNHFSCLMKLRHYTDSFNVARHIVGRVEKKAQIHEYVEDIENSVEFARLKTEKKSGRNVTKKAFDKVMTLVGKTYTTKELDTEISKIVSKYDNKQVSAKDMKKLFHVTRSRTMKERLSTLNEPTVEMLAVKHQLPENDIRKSIARYVMTSASSDKVKREREKAIQSIYGIDSEIIATNKTE